MLQQASGSSRVRVILAAVVALVASVVITTAASAGSTERGPSVAVANRGSASVSVIDIESGRVDTIGLAGSEPMYVNHDAATNRVLVGDRANSQIIVLDDQSYAELGRVNVGAGVFHQWLDQGLRQLWVVGDTSNTVTVVDLDTLAVQATIAMPADLVARGGRPHDVFVDGRRAFVSFVGLDDGNGPGVVVQYSTRRFEETRRAEVGGDPHLFTNGRRLYVASQETGTVTALRKGSMAEVSQQSVPSAHGIFYSPHRGLMVTNIAGGGTDAVWALNRQVTSAQAVGDTDAPTPHNITVDSQGQAWVTHSGPTANQVSVINLAEADPTGTLITVGTNPFGLAFIDS